MGRNKLILVLSIMIILSTSAIIIGIRSFQYSSELELQVSERDSLIQEFRRTDSLRSQLNDSLALKSTNYMSSFSRGGGVRFTPEEIVRYANRISLENELLNDSLSYYKAYYNLSQKTYKHKFAAKRINTDSVEYSFEGGVPTSSQLQSIIKEKMLPLIIENNKLESAIKKYGISITNSKDGKSYIIRSLQIDSALVLLPYYRDKLEISEDGKHWIVTTTQEKKSKKK